MTNFDFLDEVKTIHQVTAYCADEEGKIVQTFKKNVTIFFRDGKLIISFGGPCEYYYEDILKWQNKDSNDYPLCIDAGGRNHGAMGSVLVRWKAFSQIMAIAAKVAKEEAPPVINNPAECGTALS